MENTMEEKSQQKSLCSSNSGLAFPFQFAAAQSEIYVTDPSNFLSGGGEMGERMQNLDWSKTTMKVGPSEWPEELKTALSICLTSRFSMTVCWGEKFAHFYNDDFKQVLGESRHPQFLGMPAEDCWRDIWPTVGPMMRSVRETGVATWVADHLLPIRNSSGFFEERYFTYSYSPIRVKNKVEGVYTALQETTWRVISEREVKTLRDLAAHSSEALTIRGACNIVADGLRTNQTDFPFAYIYMVGSTKNSLDLVEVVGIPHCDLCPREIQLKNSSVLTTIETAIVQVFDSRTHIVLDITSLEVPGCGTWNTPPTKCTILPISLPGQDTATGVIVIGMNQYRSESENYSGFLKLVSYQVASTLANARAHEEERRRAEQLAEIDKAKTTFFSNISHEFRTPLTLMLGPLEDLLSSSELVDESVKEQLDLIHRNSLRLLKLVNNLLDFSRTEAGRAQAQYVPTKLAETTKELASVFQSACEREGLQLVLNLEEIAETIFVDRDMWEKIVLNLLSNAFKYTWNGEIEVSLKFLPPLSKVELSVRDTGTGIPSDELPKIFDRFHRVAGSKGRTHEGTGIGLSLVSELVKLHGGSISVTSELGKGSEFKVLIPTGHEHLPSSHIKNSPVAALDQGIRRTYSKSTSWWLPKLESTNSTNFIRSSSYESKPRILLVDDSADMRDYLCRLLIGPYEVFCAADGYEALESVNTCLPDLILTDVMMPRMDGVSLLKELRSNPKTQILPIIFLSARAGEEARVAGLESGADDCLIKPFTARELLARVKSHLELSKVRSVAAVQAREAIEAKDHFLAVLSHELRTPLTPVLVLAESLEANSDLPLHAREDAHLIARNIQLEVKLIDDLLDVTKITKGKLVLDCHNTSIHSLIEHTLEILRPDMLEKKMGLRVNLDASECFVFGDSARLQQILWNIIKNSMKFTPSEGLIEIATRNERREIFVTITDNGIGIDQAVLPKIFNTFEQGDGKITHTFGGLGLGLSISQALAKLHLGQLTAYSEGKGKGATFTLSLPTIPTQPNDRQTSIKGPSTTPCKILLVEDNKPTLLVMNRLLSKMGHTVKTAVTASAAIELADIETFDMVVSDIGLPDKSGYELMIHLKSKHSLRGIALSGYGMEDDIRRSVESGFELHLTKPVQVMALELALHTVQQKIIRESVNIDL